MPVIVNEVIKTIIDYTSNKSTVNEEYKSVNNSDTTIVKQVDNDNGVMDTKKTNLIDTINQEQLYAIYAVIPEESRLNYKLPDWFDKKEEGQKSIEEIFDVNKKTKKTVSYIFYDPYEWFDDGLFSASIEKSVSDWEAALKAQYGGDVILIDATKPEDFIEKWNSMGKGYDKINAIVIHYHGTPGQFHLKTRIVNGDRVPVSEYTMTSEKIAELNNDKEIGLVILGTCFGANGGSGFNSVGKQFIDKDGINKVVAADNETNFSQFIGETTIKIKNKNSDGFAVWTKDEDGKITYDFLDKKSYKYSDFLKEVIER